MIEQSLEASLALITDLNRLQIFREVVQAGSFSKAALILKQPKSRVSRNIAMLERDLGMQLIYRTTRQFQLTQAGKELFQRSAPLLHEIQRTIEQMSHSEDEVSGQIRVTVPEDIGSELLGKMCFEFMKLHPKVKIQVFASNEYIDLVKEAIDVAVRIGKSKNSTMIQKKVGTINSIFVASPELLDQFGSLRKLEDVEALPYLDFTSGPFREHNIKVSNGKETKTLKMKSSFGANNFFTLRSMALQGAGISLIPSFLVRDHIAKGTLVQIFKEWAVEGHPIQILIPQQKEPPVRIRKFIDFIALRLVQHL